MVKGYCRGCGEYQSNLFTHLNKYPKHKVYINTKRIRIDKGNSTMDEIIAQGNYIVNQDKKIGEK